METQYKGHANAGLNDMQQRDPKGAVSQGGDVGDVSVSWVRGYMGEQGTAYAWGL